MKSFIKHQFTLLLFGFVFWLPITVLIFILIFLFDNFGKISTQILSLLLPEKYMYPGISIVFGLLVIYISGFILKSAKIRVLFSKIPIIGLFFGTGEVITIDRLLHMTPCLFLLSPSCMSYGWILSEEKVTISEEKAVFTLINVYYPNVPTLVTGQVFPVRKTTVIRLGNPSKEIIDLLLYAFRSPTDLKYIPWEDESPEEFKNRAKSFGLDINI